LAIDIHQEEEGNLFAGFNVFLEGDFLVLINYLFPPIKDISIDDKANCN
jgi:hypothetical protein